MYRGDRRLPSAGDHDLVRLSLAGNRGAFDRLVESTMECALATARVILLDESLAEDAVQDAFIRAYTRLPTFRYGSSFRTWFISILVNTCLDLRRKHAREIPSEALGVNLGEEQKTEDEVETRVDVRRALDSLDDAHRLTLYLFYGLDLKVKEVSHMLGVPEGTVKSRLANARRLIRGIIGRDP